MKIFWLDVGMMCLGALLIGMWSHSASLGVGILSLVGVLWNPWKKTRWEGLECHMCNQEAKAMMGPYLWCGDEDCREDITDLMKD